MIDNAEESKGLYQISSPDHSTGTRSYFQFSLATFSDSDIMLWHQRLGHPSFEYLRFLYPSISSNKIQPLKCENCILAKHTKSSHPHHLYKPSKPFHLIHSDVWGLARVPNLTNTRWFITFIDDHTRVSWVFLMKDKSEAYSLFKSFHQMVQNVFQTAIQILRTDNGREYFSNEFNQYLLKHGIIH